MGVAALRLEVDGRADRLLCGVPLAIAEARLTHGEVQRGRVWIELEPAVVDRRGLGLTTGLAVGVANVEQNHGLDAGPVERPHAAVQHAATGEIRERPRRAIAAIDLAEPKGLAPDAVACVDHLHAAVGEFDQRRDMRFVFAKFPCGRPRHLNRPDVEADRVAEHIPELAVAKALGLSVGKDGGEVPVPGSAVRLMDHCVEPPTDVVDHPRFRLGHGRHVSATRRCGEGYPPTPDGKAVTERREAVANLRTVA